MLERKDFSEDKLRKELGVDGKIYYDIIVSAKDVAPNFYNMINKAHLCDTIVIKSIENLGLSNNELYKVLTDLKKRRIKMYAKETDVELTKAEVMDTLGEIKTVARQKQLEGIKRAKENGVKFGREIQYAKDEDELNRVMSDYHKRLTTWQDASAKLGITKKSTFFYRYYKWQKDKR